MRILNATESYAPFYEFGGPPAKVRGLTKALVARGHGVTVLTADWGLRKRLEEAGAPAAEVSPFGLRLKMDGALAIYLPTWLHYRAVTWNPAVKRFLNVRLRDFDVAHIFGLYDLLGPAVAKACRKQKIPYVVEPIGMFVPIVRSFRLKRFYHRFWGRAMLAGASAVVATSEQEVRELVSGGIANEKIVLRRNGVEAPPRLPDPGRFRTARAISADARVVLFLGRLSEKKSPDLLLKAFASLPAELAGRPLRLVFAGPDESGMEARLREMAARLAVAERVEFAGPVFGESKWAAYRDADVFVLPSQNENFGNTAAESAVAGTPVIVTENCGIAPLLADTAGVVVPHSERAVADAILRVLSDGPLRDRLVEGCRTAAGRLGWASPVGEMESLYTGLAPVVPSVRESPTQE